MSPADLEIAPGLAILSRAVNQRGRQGGTIVLQLVASTRWWMATPLGLVDRSWATRVRGKELASLTFFMGQENLLLLGKTHLAVALGRRPCAEGIHTTSKTANLRPTTPTPIRMTSTISRTPKKCEPAQIRIVAATSAIEFQPISLNRTCITCPAVLLLPQRGLRLPRRGRRDPMPRTWAPEAPQANASRSTLYGSRAPVGCGPPIV
jgi:hypothetical protein